MDNNLTASAASSEVLSDSFELSGHDLEGFKAAVEEMTGRTKCIKVKSDDITLLHEIEIPEVIDKIDEKYNGRKEPYFILRRDTLEANNEEGKSFPIGVTDKDSFLPYQKEEMKKTTKLAARIGSERFTVSDLAMNTILSRANLAGKAVENADLQRNVFIAHNLIAPTRTVSANAQRVTVVYRETEDDAGNKYDKIFAVLGSTYAFIPQTILIRIADKVMSGGDMGNAVVNVWRVDQTRSYIYIEFPEAAEEIQEAYSLPDKMIPGFVLVSSDIGENSICIRSTTRREGSNSYSIIEEVRRKHQGRIDEDDLADAADDAVFQNYRQLPEALGRLIAKPVMDYDKVDLTDADAQSKNREKVMALVKDMVKTAAGVFSKKIQNSLIDQISAEVNPMRRYSLYDIAILFMDLGDRIEGINKESSAFVEFQKRCAKVPFVLDKRASSKPAPSDDDDDDVILV